MNQPPPPLFDTNAAATLDRVKSIFTQRGTEYSDTWRTCQFLAMKAVATELGAVIPEDAFRAIACAAFCDMKYQRLSGGYKEDSVDDGIAYNAMLVQEIRNTKASREPSYLTEQDVRGVITEIHRAHEARDPLYTQADSAAQKVNGHNGHYSWRNCAAGASGEHNWAPNGSVGWEKCTWCGAESQVHLTPVVTTP
jgi:hypothetical protein